MICIELKSQRSCSKTDSVPYKLYRATFLLHADENSNDLLSHLKGQQGHLLTIGEGKAF